MSEAGDLSILLLTLKVALTATAVNLPIGVWLAWWLSHRRGGGLVAVAADSVLALPLVLPPTAIGMLLLVLLGRNGGTGRLMEALGLDLLFTWRAAALASAVMSLPLLVRSSRTAFEEIDPRLLGVARTLGDSKMRAFRRVALPLAWRGILSGTLLSFCRALGEFGATILIAGNIPGETQTLALAIFQRTQSGRDGDALRLVALTSLLAIVATAASEIVSRRRSRPFAT